MNFLYSKKIFMIIIILAAASMGLWLMIVQQKFKEEIKEQFQQSRIIIPARPKAVTYIVRPGDTFDRILEQFGISAVERLAIASAGAEIYDLSALRVGAPLRLTQKDNPGLIKLEYEYDDENILIIERQKDGFRARNEPIIYDIKVAQAGGVIESSLYETGLEIDLKDGVIMEITNILAWQIDFVSDIRKGDSFSLLYEKRFREGQYADYGRILGIRFANQEHDYWAIFYEDQEGQKGYYDLEGNSTKKAFLKSPLQYHHISSGFSNSRLHPILKRYLAHKAIDYAAPYGTSVVSVANGRVTYAGFQGGEGLYVAIRHNETYTTQYSHFSKIAKGIKVGAKVEQEQIIGYVGSTGFSTGPHLQYAMAKNGRLVNPMEVDLPAGDPVAPEYLDDFLIVAGSVKDKL